ncbi:MAG: RidA family protein [Komarekiella atlantica HA4396-MV6]|jgi:enamine deaminase RidA (YjgF/YER057c/UK114 family)|nr:RidA family protein [Komarekiella atlantica HA4396-MV6]
MNAGIKFINTTELYNSSENGYTHVVIAPRGGTTIYISDQSGEDENGKLANDDFIAQLKQVFTNLRAALAETDASLYC